MFFRCLRIFFYILPAMCAISFFYIFQGYQKNSQDRSAIIILNGPSVAGKSSLQREIQKIMPAFFLRLGVDNLFDAPLPSALTEMVEVPVEKVNFSEYKCSGLSEGKIKRATKVYEQRVNGSGELIRAGVNTTDESGNPLLVLVVGPAGDRTIYGMNRSLKGYADAGNNLVVDYILYEKKWLKDLVNVLKGYRVYFVGVKIPLDILEEREKARGTSPVGHARSHYDFVYNPDIYDLEVDSANNSSEELAKIIKTFVEKNPEPQAFNNISKHL